MGQIWESFSQGERGWGTQHHPKVGLPPFRQPREILCSFFVQDLYEVSGDC